MLSGRVSDPVLRLVQNWQDFQQVGLSTRAWETFNTRPEPAMDANRRGPAIRTRMEGVRFRYRLTA